MGIGELIEDLKTDLGGVITEVVQEPEDRIYISVEPDDVVEANRYLFEKRKGRFAIISGVDTPDGIEILYHYCFDSLGCVVTVRTRVDRDSPEIESIAPMILGAEWIEREVHDLLGVEFKNHPNLERLILADDWPEGVYPLRRDYK